MHILTTLRQGGVAPFGGKAEARDEIGRDKGTIAGDRDQGCGPLCNGPVQARENARKWALDICIGQNGQAHKSKALRIAIGGQGQVFHLRAKAVGHPLHQGLPAQGHQRLIAAHAPPSPPRQYDTDYAQGLAFAGTEEAAADYSAAVPSIRVSATPGSLANSREMALGR